MIDKDYQLNINWCAENTAQLIAEERQYRKRIPSKQAIIADIMPYSLHQDKHFSGFVFCSAQNGIRSRLMVQQAIFGVKATIEKRIQDF